MQVCQKEIFSCVFKNRMLVDSQLFFALYHDCFWFVFAALDAFVLLEIYKRVREKNVSQKLQLNLEPTLGALKVLRGMTKLERKQKRALDKSARGTEDVGCQEIRVLLSYLVGMETLLPKREGSEFPSLGRKPVGQNPPLLAFS